MAEEERRRGTEKAEEGEIPQSAAARRIRALGQDAETQPPVSVAHVGFWENFWYHHKWKTIFIAAAALIIGIGLWQILSQETPDVYMMYAGPRYLTGREIEEAVADFRHVMEDYDGNGTKSLQLTDVSYLSPQQIEDKLAAAEAEGADIAVDRQANASQYERFEMEIMLGESVVCILDPGLYESMKTSGGLTPLAEVLPEVPAYAADEYGIPFCETEFARYFTSMHIFPEDSVLCIRRISAVAAFRGEKRTKEMLRRHTDFFCGIVGFTFPEGYAEAKEQAEAAP